MPIHGFADPFIVCCFISDDRIFIALFYNQSLTHYHFIYDIKKRRIEGHIFTKQMECTKKNFPQKCFYNSLDNMVHVFYRQGHAFNISAEDSLNTQIEKMTDMDLGQMFLINDRALITRSSSKILFFKQIPNDDDEGLLEWKLYQVLNIRGFIFFIKGNIRIQITTNEKIYFFIMDLETFIPTLENVMFNFMGCD